MSHLPPVAAPSRLASLLLDIPLGQRSSLLMAAASLQPSQDIENAFRVGALRAAFADFWETNFRTAVPIRLLPGALAPPIRIGTVLEFNLFDYLHDPAEIEAQLQRLVKHLQACVRNLNASHQRSLFLQEEPTPQPPARVVGKSVASLNELILEGHKFSTIYADPPWPYENEASRAAAVNHYPVMSLDAIRAEPVSKLVAPNAHLHLWTTNAFLRDAFSVVDAWGFKFKSCLVWVKNELGMGNYWRVSHEFLLLGVRGSLTFTDRTLQSWLLAERTLHSRKPARIRSLIERVSPGPFLELYGREELPHSEWTVYGNQIEKRLF